MIPTKSFIQEVLKRSKTTYSTLQTALFYLFRIKNIIIARLKQRAATGNSKRSSEYGTDDYLCCGRRMFLASLMVASKYLQDKNYRNKAWAKISGLDIKEINGAETAFLKIIDYRLFISKPTFDRWFTLLNLHVDQMQQQQQQQIQCSTEDANPTRLYPTPSSSPVRHSPYRKPVQQHYPSPPNSIHEYETMTTGVSPSAASQMMFSLPVSVCAPKAPKIPHNSFISHCWPILSCRIKSIIALQMKRKSPLLLCRCGAMKWLHLMRCSVSSVSSKERRIEDVEEEDTYATSNSSTAFFFFTLLFFFILLSAFGFCFVSLWAAAKLVVFYIWIPSWFSSLAS